MKQKRHKIYASRVFLEDNSALNIASWVFQKCYQNFLFLICLDFKFIKFAFRFQLQESLKVMKIFTWFQLSSLQFIKT